MDTLKLGRNSNIPCEHVQRFMYKLWYIILLHIRTHFDVIVNRWFSETNFRPLLYFSTLPLKLNLLFHPPFYVLFHPHRIVVESSPLWLGHRDRPPLRVKKQTTRPSDDLAPVTILGSENCQSISFQNPLSATASQLFRVRDLTLSTEAVRQLLSFYQTRLLHPT